MNYRLPTIVGAALLMINGQVLAGGPNNLSLSQQAAQKHFYVGMGVGYAYAPDVIKNLDNFFLANGVSQDQIDDLNSLSTNKGGIVFNFHLGYNFTRHFGVEAGYMRMQGLGYNNDNTNTFLGYDNNNVYYAALTGIYLPTPSIQLFAKAGYSIITSEVDLEDDSQDIKVENSSNTNFQPYLGVGAQYMASPQFGINIEYNLLISTSNNKNGNHFPTTHIALAGFNFYFYR